MNASAMMQQIEAAIAVEHQHHGFRNALASVVRNISVFRQLLVDRDPIWGNASIDEIVSARMGALGIV